jgi:hypothetical protein
MKTYEGVDVQIHVFLTSALVGGEWSALPLGRLIPGERVPGTHCIGGWMGPRTGLGDLERRKFLPLPELELRLSAVQTLASRSADFAVPAAE